MPAPERPVLIAVDAATLPASVALLGGAEPLASEVAPDDPKTDTWILPAVDRCLARASLALEEIDGLAVTVGPGMFTGIRVGLATCLGLAAPLDLPVCGVLTLDALATLAPPDAGPVVACLDARRGQLYAALYEETGTAALPLPKAWGPAACRPEELARRLEALEPPATVVGAGAALLPGEPLRAAPAAPIAVGVGRLAVRIWGTGDPDTLPEPRPFYLRGADVRRSTSPLAKGDRGAPPA